MKTHIFELTTYETKEVVTRYTVEAESKEQAKKLFLSMCDDFGIEDLNIYEENLEFDSSPEKDVITFGDLTEKEQKLWVEMANSAEELSCRYKSVDFIIDKEYLGTDIP